MKFLLPTLAVAVVYQASASCLSSCNQHTLNGEEDLCTDYRDQLPRPTLYNFCVDAYRKGGQRACEEYCGNTGNADAVLGSLQSQSCDHLRTTRPKAALTICNKAFRTAATRAKLFVENGAVIEEPKARAAAAVEDKPKEKQEIKIEPKKKSPLEAARDEAKVAFETDASRLGEL